MVVMLLAGLTEQIEQRAYYIKCRPAYVEPAEAGGQGVLGIEKMQDKVGSGAHQQAGDGDKLVAVER